MQWRHLQEELLLGSALQLLQHLPMAAWPPEVVRRKKPRAVGVRGGRGVGVGRSRGIRRSLAEKASEHLKLEFDSDGALGWL